MTMGFNNQNLFYYETNLFDYDKAWSKLLYHLNKTNGKFDHGPKMVWFGFEASVTIHQDLDCLGCFREDLELVWYGLI